MTLQFFCESTSNKLNPEVIGNILGKSCFDIPPLDVMKSRGRAPATNSIQSTANSKSPNAIEDLPAALVANDSPVLIPEEELPPIFEATAKTQIVDNPFLAAYSRNAEINQDFWPSNLIQLVREIVSLPSIQPSDPEFKFSLDREAVMINFNVLKKYELNLKVALEAQKNLL